MQRKKGQTERGGEREREGLMREHSKERQKGGEAERKQRALEYL